MSFNLAENERKSKKQLIYKQKLDKNTPARLVPLGKCHNSPQTGASYSSNDVIRRRVVSRARLFGSGLGLKLTKILSLISGLKSTFCLKVHKNSLFWGGALGFKLAFGFGRIFLGSGLN